MALKKKIGALNEVAKEMQGFYVPDGDAFKLDVDGDDDIGPALRAKEHEKKERMKAEKERNEALDELKTLREEIEAAKEKPGKKKEVEELEESYKKKLAKTEKDLTDKFNAVNAEYDAHLIDSETNRLATEISTAPTLLAPHIKNRLKVEVVDGKRVVRVLDGEGKVSAATLDEYKKEISGQKEYAAVIIGSKAAGSGAAGAKGGGGAGPVKTVSRAEVFKMSPAQRGEFFKANPDVQQTD